MDVRADLALVCLREGRENREGAKLVCIANQYASFFESWVRDRAKSSGHGLFQTETFNP